MKNARQVPGKVCRGIGFKWAYLFSELHCELQDCAYDAFIGKIAGTVTAPVAQVDSAAPS